MIDPVYIRWCGCGLMVAGTGLKIAAQCAAHWRQHGCPWQLHETNPNPATGGVSASKEN